VTRLLTLSNLFPSEEFPRHGIFVEERLRQLLATGRVEAKVFAPVPWFPFKSARFGTYGRYARVARQEERLGCQVRYPRFPLIPKVSMAIAPLLMAMAVYRHLRVLEREWLDTAIIDAHYLYPDGVAAVLLGKWLRRPVVLTARGQDVTLLPEYRIPRAWIKWACARAAHVVTVSESLRHGLVDLGVSPAKLSCLRNGVDLKKFQPQERTALRRDLGMEGMVLLAVGNLIELKGHALIIAALGELPDAQLHLIGEGPEQDSLAELARQLGVSQRCYFHGNMPHTQLAHFYNAADALVLPSSREGMPNVVLEALACGTPVIATAVGGVPELIDSEDVGVLLQDRSSAAIAAGVRELQANPCDRDTVRRHGEGLGWSSTVDGLLGLYAEIGENGTRAGPNIGAAG